MSENTPHDPQPTPGAPVDVDVAAQLASARRRRFIKMGAGAVPVALTLASRPVMATNCMTASAWGSTMGLNGTSQYTRAVNKSIGISGALSLAQWTTSTYNSATRLNDPTCTSWKTSVLCGTSATAQQIRDYKVSALCGANAVSGISSPTTTSVWSVLTSTGTSDSDKYKRAMLVAWLNFKLSTTVQKCVTDPTRPTVNNLKSFGSIGTGGGTGPDGKHWSQAMVVKYLFDNWIAR